MVAHQLDLFGGPLKPPKKIKLDDDVPVDEQSPDLVAQTKVPGPTDSAIPDALHNVSENTNNVEPNLIEPTSDYWQKNKLSDETSALAEAELLYLEKETYINRAASEVLPAFTKNEETPDADDTVFSVLQEDAGVENINNAQSDNKIEITFIEENIAEPSDSTHLTTADIAPETMNHVRKSSQEQEEDNDGLRVPPDEELFKRQYYSMRETSAMFGVNQSLLRFWENEFDILQPKKNKKGDRYFRPVDVKNLGLIHHLLRIRKFTMDGAKDYLQKHKKAGDTFELIKRLEKLKSFLIELKAGL